MAYTKLADVSVGNAVKLNVGGSEREFVVVHQGLPSEIYDESCNGTWLLMKDIYENRQWHNNNDTNKYAESDIHSYLNSTFLNLFDSNIKDAIKQVKIPYVISYNQKTANNGANGLSCKIFLLDRNELNAITGTAIDGAGAVLDYFASCPTTDADPKRIAYLNGSAADWWLRSPFTYPDFRVFVVRRTGKVVNPTVPSATLGIRPAFVLPDTLLISEDGMITVNAPPVVTSTTANGSNLGLKNEGFNFSYSVSDENADDELTVKEYLDDVLQRTYAATKGQTVNFQAVTAANFQKVLNGTHTLKVIANDGKDDSEAYTASFTKKVTKATVTLAEALSADDAITVMVMNIAGSLPADAALEVLVTNNANDTSPAWEDATADVKAGTNHVFTNQTAANGFAFNFKLSVERGSSDTGGYISNIGGAFE